MIDGEIRAHGRYLTRDQLSGVADDLEGEGRGSSGIALRRRRLNWRDVLDDDRVDQDFQACPIPERHAGVVA